MNEYPAFVEDSLSTKVQDFLSLAAIQSPSSSNQECVFLFDEILAKTKKMNRLGQDDRLFTILETLFCFTAYLRDISFGRGNRQLTYAMLLIWYTHYPVLAVYALEMIVGAGLISGNLSFGSWRDIPGLCEYIRVHSDRGQSHPFIESAIEIMNGQLYKDWISGGGGGDGGSGGDGGASSSSNSVISNVAKWIPRESSRKHKWLFDKMVMQWSWTHSAKILHTATNSDGRAYVRAIHKCRQQYRRVFTSLTRLIDPVECKQCAGQWDQIRPEKVCEGALSKYWDGLLNQTRVLDTLSNDPLRIQCASQFQQYFDCEDQKEKGFQVRTISKSNSSSNSWTTPYFDPSFRLADEKTILHLVLAAIRCTRLSHLKRGLDLNVDIEIRRIDQRWKRILQKRGGNGNGRGAGSGEDEQNIIPIVTIVGTGPGGYLQRSDIALYYKAIAQACFLAGPTREFGRRILFASSPPILVNLDGCEGFVDSIRRIMHSTTNDGIPGYNYSDGFDEAIELLRVSTMAGDNVSTCILGNHPDCPISNVHLCNPLSTRYRPMKERFWAVVGLPQ